MKITELFEDQEPTSLHDALAAAGIEVSSHESDLYFPMTKQAVDILNKFPLQKKNATSFINQDTKTRWVDVPFAYDPFWKKKIPEDREPGRVSLLKDHTMVRCDDGKRYEFQGLLSADEIKSKTKGNSGIYSIRKVNDDGKVIDQHSGTF